MNTFKNQLSIRINGDAPEDLVDLVDLTISREKRALGDHFCEDRADGPHVDGQGIGLGSEEDLRRTVPQSHNLMCERSDRRHKCTGKTEVGNLKDTVAGNKNVLRLQVTG